MHEVTLVGRDGKPLINPAVIEHERERRQSVENRIADQITAFSGSMRLSPPRSPELGGLSGKPVLG